jgi:hypothetical protein
MPALTVEQYALLCAERERFPERLADTNARYQLFDDVVRRTVDKNWQDRLAADPALYQTWAQLHAQYKAWLMGRRE